MKKHFLLLPALCVCGAAMAQDMGRVISSTPVMQQVGVPRQVCTTEQVEMQPPKSGAGAALGAIAGGALGSATGGHGAGRAAATVIGAIGGAMVGDRIEGTPETQMQTIQRCGTQTYFENRAVAYNVVYEYAGKQYAVQMPNDPGPAIALQVTPVGSSGQMDTPAPMLTQASPVYIQPATSVVVTRQFYPYYYPQPLFAPISIGLGFGYRDRHWGRGYENRPPPPPQRWR